GQWSRDPARHVRCNVSKSAGAGRDLMPVHACVRLPRRVRREGGRKMPTHRIRTLAAAALLATTLGACGTGFRAAVYVADSPTRAVVEVRGAHPGGGHAWIRGYYQWTGPSYVWVPGHWERWP